MRTAFKIEPGELRATLLSFFFMLTLMASYYLLRPIRDAMSSNWTDAELSTLFSATFLFSIVAVMLYGAACSRIRFRRLVPGVYGLFALSFVGFYFAVGSNQDAEWARKSFYVWISVFSLFHVSVFWSYMADIFSREQAPRLFGFIASGASIGAIIGPAIAVTMVGAVGTGNLLLVSASLLVIPIIVISTLEKERNKPSVDGNKQQDGHQAIGGNPFAGFTLFLKNPYLLAIGLFILLYTALSTLVYFELKNLLAGLEEDPVSLFDSEIPNQGVAKSILHQAVDGNMNHRTEIRSSLFDITQHSPFKLTFVSFFLEHTSLFGSSKVDKGFFFQAGV
jgi:AAA family ATP:ADP antiporter